ANVMAVIAIGIAEQKPRSVAAPGTLHQKLRKFVDGAHILPIHGSCFDVKCRSPRQDFSRCRFGIVRVFVVEIVFADVDDGQLEKLSQVHYLVEHALPQRAFSEETDCYLVRTQALSRERSPCRYATLPPTMAFAPRLPVDGSAMCMEPPLPLQYPASLPSSSANIRWGDAPLARQCP